MKPEYRIEGKFYRKCDECGNYQEAKHPSTYVNDAWRDVKCKTCKSEGLDFGSYYVAYKDDEI
jgi:ribosomal protein S27E